MAVIDTLFMLILSMKNDFFENVAEHERSVIEENYKEDGIRCLFDNRSVDHILYSVIYLLFLYAESAFKICLTDV